MDDEDVIPTALQTQRHLLTKVVIFSTLYADVKELAPAKATAQQAAPLFDRRLSPSSSFEA